MLVQAPATLLWTPHTECRTSFDPIKELTFPAQLLGERDLAAALAIRLDVRMPSVINQSTKSSIGGNKMAILNQAQSPGPTRLSSDQILQIARIDAEHAYRDLSGYRITLALEADGWQGQREVWAIWVDLRPC